MSAFALKLVDNQSETVQDISEDYDIAQPRADAMIHSLRAFGYDLATALADLIDNSIAANAKNIWLDFHWNGEKSTISVVDDGKGMTEPELLAAMRPGSRSPLLERDPKDLGRFGLGLKTASFSQAKLLTVGTKLDDALAVRCWDLDYVTKCGDWRLLKKGSEKFNNIALTLLEPLSSGSMVFWEAMDRITPIGTQVDNDKAQENFLQRAEKVKAHLAMVFHRFLDPRENPGKTPLKIWLNGNQIKEWDPYLSHETATQLLTEEAVSLLGSRLVVKPYVLPHHSKISSEKHKAASGVKGWNAQQGFYVYRNRRLLAAGTWLGLGFQQEEHYKLARIQLDIPNHMDAEWEIDVKKSRATPPPSIKEQLKTLATATRSIAAAIYRHRGARIQNGSKEIVFLWNQKSRRGKVFYEINRDHPIVSTALEVGGAKVRNLLHMIEETIPIATITRDWSADPTSQTTPFDEKTNPEMIATLKHIYQSLTTSGNTPKQAKIILLNMEPFHLFPSIVESIEE